MHSNTMNMHSHRNITKRAGSVESSNLLIHEWVLPLSVDTRN